MAVKKSYSSKPGLSKLDKKEIYCAKLSRLLDEYSKVLVVHVDNVGSNQIQQIRAGLRGDSVVLMGKNTLMRRAINKHIEKTGNTSLTLLEQLLKGNVGLVFTRGDLKEIREKIGEYKVGAPARVGLIAPIDVVIPVGNTGLDPSNTSFFQALNIPTKINKGTVEIITPVDIIKKGDKVGSSEASLLTKLSIRPFSYGLVVQKVFEDGSVYDPEVLDLTEDDLAEKFAAGLTNVVAVTLGLSYPSIVGVPHMIINGYENVLSVSVATEYSFPLAEEVKEYLKDPSKFAAAAAPVAAATGGGGGGAAKEEEKKEESEESEVEGGMMSLFDD